MFRPATDTPPLAPRATGLDRVLSLFTDVRPGEAATAALLLLNVFVLLVCYAVIKTVREPLILLGGGAEVRSYAAAGQALLLIGFVPLYSWLASRVDRRRLLIAVTAFFLCGIELFAAAVAAHVPYVGVAFFIWVGIFNMSLVAQFWSFANDIYDRDAAARLFPIIMVGMTAGAPLGSIVAGRLFHSGVSPQVILQVAAVLLTGSLALYLAVSRRVTRTSNRPDTQLAAGGGFELVLRNPYLRLIAGLVVLLNIVNTTGEYVVARLLTEHVTQLALVTPGFDKQAYIGAFTGEYQFWVNATALLLQAFVTARVVRITGLTGALLALPLIALGGYAIIAAGVGFSVVRWIKTAENATDYSLMNTARQLLWVPATREEKYKAKQAIDTFFVRGGDVLSAGVVYVGATLLHLDVTRFAMFNVALTIVWLTVALRLSGAGSVFSRLHFPRLAGAAAAVLVVGLAIPATAQETREESIAAQQAEKASNVAAYQPDALDRRLEQVQGMMSSQRPIYAFIGSAFAGGGLAVGPAYRARFGDTGTFNAHAAWSIRNYKAVEASVAARSFGRVTLRGQASYLDAPAVAFYGTGSDTTKADRREYSYNTRSVGALASVRLAPVVSIGAGVDALTTKTHLDGTPAAGTLNPTYARTKLFAAVDTRPAARYTRTGSLYRVDWSNYAQTNAGNASFSRVDAEVQHFIPLLRENWVIALRALASTTQAATGESVPYFLMPDLGGSHTLRGYSPWRFRDRNRVLLTGEYRWTAGPFVDMALFVDAGKVAGRARDLDLSGLTTSYGIGMTLHTLTSTVTRLEVARTREGTSLLLSFGPSF